MKARITYLVICLLMTVSLKAQIKIGDNPQNLDPASVLELESNSRVLVITRMTTIQMENTSPLRGAVVYNTDTQCVHFYDGALWINLCDRPDEQTFTTDAIVNFSPTMIITPDANGTNFNFEVGEIRGENIVDTSINGTMDLQPLSISETTIAPRAITLSKLADGTAPGQLLQWAGPTNGWVLIDESAITVTEIDGVVGNEILDAADGTLVRTGLGDSTNPFVLDVSVGGITNLELGADAVTSDKILNGEVDTDDISNDAITNIKMANDAIDTDEIVDDAVTADKIDVSVAGSGLTQNLATGALDVDVASLTGDGDITSADLTVTGGADAAFTNVNLEITAGAVGNTELAADAVTTDKIANGAVESTDIAADAVNAATINVDVAGSGLTQNLATGALDVDVASLTGDGDITSADLTVTGGTDAAFTNVNLEITAGAVGNTEIAADAVTTDKIANGAVESTDIAADAVNAATINVDVAGSGLTQNLATGALDVDVASLTGDGDITSADLTVTGGTDAAFTNVNLEITAGAVGNTEIAADAVTTDKIADGTITNDDINAAAAILGTKINPDFGANDVITAGDFISNGTTLIVPDFVFEKYYGGFSNLNADYKFNSLETVESFIKEHNHLPGIRSAYEIEASGEYRLTESSLNHLEKIEELFLHTIEQEKKIEELKSDNEKLTEEINSLKSDIQLIKNMLSEKDENK